MSWTAFLSIRFDEVNFVIVKVKLAWRMVGRHSYRWAFNWSPELRNISRGYSPLVKSHDALQ